MSGITQLLRLFCQRGQLILIGYRLGDLMRHQQLRFGVYRPLTMIADIAALTSFHGATRRIGQSALTFFPRLQGLQQRLGWSLARASWFNVRVQLISCRMLGLRLAMIICLQLFESGMNLLMDLLTQARALFLTNIPLLAVDGLEFAALDRDQLLSKSITSLA
jgi:hypothetical protein